MICLFTSYSFGSIRLPLAWLLSNRSVTYKRKQGIGRTSTTGVGMGGLVARATRLISHG